MVNTSTGTKTFELRPISELISIVKNDLEQLDNEGLIDEGKLIKTIMYCNDKLGIGVREIKQSCLQVTDFRAKLPLNFDKLYFATAISATNTNITNFRNPFDNSFDRDVIYEADIAREDFGGTDFYGVTIKRNTDVTIHSCNTFVKLDVHPQSLSLCHSACPNVKKPGKYTIQLKDDHIETPFRCGEIYIMYIANAEDEFGNLLFPFHPRITPYYEWAIKEKVLQDAVYNREGGYMELLKDARNERVKAWLEAFDITTEKGFGEYVAQQRKKEMGWYNQWFKFFQT